MGPNCKTAAFDRRLMKCLYLINGMSQLFAASVACLTVKVPEICRVIMWN